MKDLLEVEKAAFSGFLKGLGLKTMHDYEAQCSSDSIKAINEAKNTNMQKIDKAKRELDLLTGSEHSKAVDTLESILRQEEEKLSALLTGGDNMGYVQKLQTEL